MERLNNKEDLSVDDLRTEGTGHNTKQQEMVLEGVNQVNSLLLSMAANQTAADGKIGGALTVPTGFIGGRNPRTPGADDTMTAQAYYQAVKTYCDGKLQTQECGDVRRSDAPSDDE